MSYLRDYQADCQTAVFAELEKVQSTLVVMATGLGKTETGLSILDNWQGDGICLWIAHREELIFQPWNRWKDKTGEYAEMEMAKFRRDQIGEYSRVVFASKDSIFKEKRLRESFPDPTEVGLIIIDEAHHAVPTNKTYQNILDYFKQNQNLKIVGLTATPDRTDEEALGQTFDSVAFEYPLYDPGGGPSAISEGWLVPIEQQYVTVDDVNFDVVGTRGGDFIDSQLALQMTQEKALMGQCSTGMDLAGDGTTLVFAASIDQAVKQAELFNRLRSDSAKTIASKVDDYNDFDFVYNSSDKEERRNLLKSWGKGMFQFFCNVGIFTEGMDEPTIRTILMGRPTKSRSLYAQMSGRGTRILPGVIEGMNEQGERWRLESSTDRKHAIANSDKPFIRIVDFVGNSRHSLISSYDILGGQYSDDVIARAKEQKGESPKSVVEELNEAAQQIHIEAQEMRRVELERRKRLVATSTYKAKKIDPFGAIGVVTSREKGWNIGRKATDRQKASLKKFGVDERAIEEMSFTKASDLMDGLVKRIKTNMASYKQCNLLAKYGEDGSKMSFQQASSTITKIKNNGWKPLI